jgi:hypothetical protein
MPFAKTLQGWVGLFGMHVCCPAPCAIGANMVTCVIGCLQVRWLADNVGM